MNKEEQLSRLKKYLALSKSTNPHEAAIALQRAQKLMQEHDLSAHDVSLSEIQENQISTERGLKERRIVFKLGHIVCDAFGLKFFVTSSGSSVGSVTLIGPSDRLESGIYVLTFLMRQLQIVKKEFRLKQRTDIELRLQRQLKNSPFFVAMQWNYLKNTEEIKQTISNALRKETQLYLEGWLNAVRSKVQALVVPEEEQNLLLEYEEKFHPELITVSQRSRKLTNGQWQAFKQGKIDGQDGFELYQGVRGTLRDRLTFKP